MKPAAGTGASARVLIVDDEKEIHEDFEDMLSRTGGAASDQLAAAFVAEENAVDLNLDFELRHASSGEEAFELIASGKRHQQPIAVAYVDIRMPPGIDGVETVRRIRSIDREVEIVIMTAYADKPLPEIVHDMELLHKLLYIRKPFAREEVQQITLALTEKWGVERELAARRREIDVSHQRLEAVLDATGEAMALYDDSQRLLFANTWYEKIMGTREADMQAMSPHALNKLFKERVQRPAPVDEGTSMELSDDSGDVVEHVVADQEKSRVFYRSRKPVQDGRGDAIGSLYVYRDISTEIEIERMRKEVVRLRSQIETTYSFSGIIGSSPAMQRVYELMKRTMDSDVTVLVTGESGTGKELVAKALHFGGRRKEHPFVAVNCAAIPPTLIESELFGHEQGSFTGATTHRLGCFERAHGGTVLLDEVGDMHPDLQAKLLRVLQEREIQRVGGTTSIAVDVRVVAATNQDPSVAVKAGAFRTDLYYRLSAFRIAIPPLRERREDIRPLVDHFLKQSCERNGKSVTGVSPVALRVLMRHEWPGNVRELHGAVERAVLLEETDTLQAANLPPELSPVVPAPGKEALSLAAAEGRAIHRALEAADHNVSRAAQLLGISRATLHRKLKRHGPAE